MQIVFDVAKSETAKTGVINACVSINHIFMH